VAAALLKDSGSFAAGAATFARERRGIVIVSTTGDATCNRRDRRRFGGGGEPSCTNAWCMTAAAAASPRA
jgi:hypothetical protein